VGVSIYPCRVQWQDMSLLHDKNMMRLVQVAILVAILQILICPRQKLTEDPLCGRQGQLPRSRILISVRNPDLDHWLENTPELAEGRNCWCHERRRRVGDDFVRNSRSVSGYWQRRRNPNWMLPIVKRMKTVSLQSNSLHLTLRIIDTCLSQLYSPHATCDLQRRISIDSDPAATWLSCASNTLRRLLIS
jgi:hypothetical protein